METDRELLPVVVVGEKEFLVDVKRREFRGFRDREYRIDMHSVRGREMVEAMAGMEWWAYGLDNLPATPGTIRCDRGGRSRAKS